ncbi:MAG: DUF2063 domain-containing protein [Gammaproteobacteria bacterium HGW-Gammaproteobacteria-1]|jgi:hypothetical protein|nr:MAG: DUF2063 domain-containing protein [Gammaproteobacteria bacterium HGW-Gammaproteobacteria-1]
MSALAGLQRGLSDFLLHGGDGCAVGVAAAPGEAGTRLGIYANAYRLRLHEALATDYTLLAAWLGEARFVQLLDEYIAAHPSHHFNIRWFGCRMAEFVAGSAPWSDEPILADLAEFEWAQGLSFDAPDGPLLEAGAVAGLPAVAWETLRISFHPAVHRRDFHWNVHELWHALLEGRPLPPPLEYVVPVPWLFWRRERRSYYTSLDRDAARALDLALDGADFPAVCMALRAWWPDDVVPERAASLLKSWVNEGFVSGICLGAVPRGAARCAAASFRSRHSGEFGPAR